MRNFQLEDESADLRNQYGGEFGQRCLLARRLVQAGVRFIEVSHNLNFINGTGWDTHNEGQQNQHLLIKELDIALAALIADLEARAYSTRLSSLWVQSLAAQLPMMAEEVEATRELASVLCLPEVD